MSNVPQATPADLLSAVLGHGGLRRARQVLHHHVRVTVLPFAQGNAPSNHDILDQKPANQTTSTSRDSGSRELSSQIIS
jgi:hypothetical protein